MSNRKDHENMLKLDNCYKVVLQNSAKGGTRVNAIAEELGVHRTTVYNYLNSLELMGKVESHQGLWKAKTTEPTIKPLEKKIEIVLPIPKNEVHRLALLENLARDWEKGIPNDNDNPARILLEKFNEARTITIRGKNVDGLDLEKIANLIEQASENSSKFNLKGILRKLKF
jgi:AcrR family transcriptional regulator